MKNGLQACKVTTMSERKVYDVFSWLAGMGQSTVQVKPVQSKGKRGRT